MLGWLKTGGDPTAAGGAEAVHDEQSCPGLSRALQRLLGKEEQPEVLDLGQFSRSAAVYLANRGARVSVENFQPPPPAPKKKKRKNGNAEAEDDTQAVVIPHPDRKFHLVLAWEHWDFVPPDRLADFASEVRRVLTPGGWLLMYCQDNPGGEEGRPERPACYRLTADDRVVRTQPSVPEQPRWTHANRTIERALAPMSVQAIHLQRNRIREFLVRKPEDDGDERR